VDLQVSRPGRNVRAFGVRTGHAHMRRGDLTGQ